MAKKNDSTSPKAIPAGHATTPHPRPAITRELITLDFHEYGIERKLVELLDMAKKGEINGLIFSVRMTRKGSEPYLHGCEGRLLDNQAEAIGAAVLLQNKLAAM